MKKVVFLSISVFAFGLLPISFPISYPEDVVYDSTLQESELDIQFSKKWNYRVAFENKFKKNPNAIDKRVVWEKDNEKIILDSWNNRYSNSLYENSRILSEKYADKDKKAKEGKIAGLKALFNASIEDDPTKNSHISALFQSKKTVYRITYVFSESQNYNYFYNLLKRISHKEAKNTSDLENLFKVKSGDNTLSTIGKAYAANYCGNYEMAGNNFPCCESGGNCTWWAIYKRQDLKDVITWGNAGQDWIDQADDADYPILSDPIDGSISVWGPVYDESDNVTKSGHVAYVNSVSTTDSFSISEMNCSGSAAPGPRDVNVSKNYVKIYWELPLLGFIGSKGNITEIRNQTIQSGTFTSNSQINIYPDTVLNPIYGDIILRIQ